MTAQTDPPAVDPIDRLLIDHLVGDAKATTRSLATALGLGVANVAKRIRRLQDDNLLRVTAVFDSAVVGYRCEAFLALRAVDRHPRDIAAELAQWPAVKMATTTAGSADLVVDVLARDQERLVEFLDERLGSVAGIRVIDVGVVAEALQYRIDWAQLPRDDPVTFEFPAPAIAIDDTDRSIMAAFVADARQSNRSIADAAGVSEATVRARLQRLERAGVMRIVAQSPLMLGDGHDPATAWLAVRAVPGGVRALQGQLIGRRDVPLILRLIGAYDLLAVVAAPSTAGLRALVAETLHGNALVDHFDLWPIVDAVHHRFHWARLLGSAPGGNNGPTSSS